MLKPDKKKKQAASNPQGISSRGNALRKIVLLALLAALVPMLLGFSYLLMVREPDARHEQMDRVATAWASQQATNIHHLFTRLSSRVLGAANSPMALQAIATESERTIELVEQAMLDYFPEVVSLRLLPIGEMGTAAFESGNQGLRNHIEVDLARRASEGADTEPVAYKFENQWLTSLAELVLHPRVPGKRAVIIATIENKLLTERLQSLDTDAGRFSLEQLYRGSSGNQLIDIIATAGNGDIEEYSRHADIPGTSWRVNFTPSRSLQAELDISTMPVSILLAVVVLSALLAAGLVLLLFPRALTRDFERVISAADKKNHLVLQVPELVSLAKQLRRATLRNLRQSNTSALPQPIVETKLDSAANLTNPMFQKTSILDEDEEALELELSDSPDEQAPKSGTNFPDHIFRAYDIRGDATTELTDKLVAQIGAALAIMAKEQDEQTLVVGCDGRRSSPRIKATLIKALMESGRDVIDIGLVPTPLLYFATRYLESNSGIMITGSHNAAEVNGMKVVLAGKTIAAGGIQHIRELVIAGKVLKGGGRMIREDIVPAYVEEVVSDIAIAIPLKVVIDAGNGATSDIAPELFGELGCEVIPLYCEIDGSFPNHPPDTSNEDNLADLVSAVKEHGADFGVAFDGDGDRLAVVTGGGAIVRSDVLMMIFARDVVARNPGADVVFDVKCSRNLTQVITRYGGRPVLWKTGHAFMKEKMVETGALLGGEFSGHIFFGERWYGFDDGMYAAARLAEILSTLGQSMDETIVEFPQTVNTPELLIPVPEETKFALMERISRGVDFEQAKVNTLDGIRVDFNEGWGLLRASNTSAALTARFEAETEESLEAIKQEFREQIALAAPDLKPEF